jgi:hypothetical protein
MSKQNRIILACCVLALLVAVPLVAFAIRKSHVDESPIGAEAAKQNQPLTMLMPETYWVIGPFGPGHSNSYEPERKADPALPCHTPDGEELHWVAKAIIPGANCLDFRKALLQPNTDDMAAYALVYAHSLSEQTGKMLLGSDDTITVWLNGVMVHDNPAFRLGKADQDQVPVVWRQGWNTVLFKVGNGKNDHLLFAKFLAPEPLRAGMSNKDLP